MTDKHTPPKPGSEAAPGSEDGSISGAAGSENLLRHASTWRGAAPVEQWDPPYCGEMDMRIAADGTWYHEGSPIGRQPLVQLFSSILRREPDGHHYLVTPVEKLRIQVDDCPFVAVLLEVIDQGTAQQILRFTLNTGEKVDAGPDNPIEVEYPDGDEPHPIIHLARGLRALISRSVFYDLVEISVLEGDSDDSPKAAPDKASSGFLGVRSNGKMFNLGAL